MTNFLEIQISDKANLRIKKSAIIATIINENNDREIEIYVKNAEYPFHVQNTPQLREKLNAFWYGEI